MSKRAPYTFPHRSRKSMLEYLLKRDSYMDHYELFPFSWNVKTHAADWTRPEGESKLDPALDSAWEKYIESNHGLQMMIMEDCGREYTEGEWTSYPGDDQGDWKFEFRGRQGGHLCLTHWQGKKLSGHGLEKYEIEDWLKELSTERLRQFYKGIRTADSDFTRAKAARNLEWYINDARGQWEEEKRKAKEAAAVAMAEAIAAERPDLAPQWEANA